MPRLARCYGQRPLVPHLELSSGVHLWCTRMICISVLPRWENVQELQDTSSSWMSLLGPLSMISISCPRDASELEYGAHLLSIQRLENCTSPRVMQALALRQNGTPCRWSNCMPIR